MRNYLNTIISNECNIVIRAFGDSHADIIQIEGLKNIPTEHVNSFKIFSYSNHGKLMNSIGRDGFDIHNILKSPRTISIRPWGHERKFKLFDLRIPGVAYRTPAIAPLITEKDILYFQFGEIDARTKLSEILIRQRRTDIFDEINRLVDSYWISILKSISEVNSKTVWISGLHPQPIITEYTNGWSPITGTFEYRWICVLLINRKLKKYADEYGFFFIDLTDGYSTPEGDLDMTMSDGNHHINMWTEDTKNKVAQQLLNHKRIFC